MSTPHLPDRRQFLTTASALAASLIASHPTAALEKRDLTSSRAEHRSTPPRILKLELLTSAPLSKMKEFYHQSIGLRVLEERPDRLTLAAGETRLTFVPASDDSQKPFYHFAFNIPENKIVDALKWQKQRSPLIHIPETLRDPKYPDEVVNYSHWNAHSIFFLDPGGNVVEYIARHDLKNAAPGEFGTRDILYASEIAFIVDNVLATASSLKEVVGIEQYKGGNEQFSALGDEQGLLLVMKRGRILNFNSASDEKAARVFKTTASVRVKSLTRHLIPEFPYEVLVES